MGMDSARIRKAVFHPKLAISYLLARIHTNPSVEAHLYERNRKDGFVVTDGDFQLENRLAEIDPVLLRRISKAYAMSKRDQPQSGPYAVSGMWQGILEADFGDLTSALRTNNLNQLEAYLKNCFRQGTRGLSMSGDMPDLMSRKAISEWVDSYADNLLRLSSYLSLPNPRKGGDNEEYVSDEKVTLQRLWRAICEKAGVPAAYPNAGNPFGLRLMPEGSVVPKVAARHLHTALRVKELSGDDPHILEIGGGFGGVQYYLAKLLKSISVVSLDIPEVNAISSYFLSSALSDVDVRFYGEGEPKSSRCIRILPNWCLEDESIRRTKTAEARASTGFPKWTSGVMGWIVSTTTSHGSGMATSSESTESANSMARPRQNRLVDRSDLQTGSRREHDDATGVRKSADDGNERPSDIASDDAKLPEPYS